METMTEQTQQTEQKPDYKEWLMKMNVKTTHIVREEAAHARWDERRREQAAALDYALRNGGT